MQVSFVDLVGTAVVPAHCFDRDELTGLAPALDTATSVDGMESQASEAVATYNGNYGPGCAVEAPDLL